MSDKPESVEQQVEAAAAAEQAAAQIAELEAALAEAQAKAAEHYEQLLRTHAEAENVRRRAQEDVSKARKFGIESFAESLVPVKDSLEAALAQAEQSPESWREGVETTLRQLVGAFERHHLKDIAPAVGEKFDPHLHQAISSVPADQPANTIVAVLQKGYLISDRVLRPALVTVAAGS
ncbi:MAG: nucleotide exchange factor GrpE [Corticimicrobacter sp.]|uniref:nucleotide exchange factor GrpE n=1 Tax=Corticimicrobacter sp. TaxID=2678536 RepID=UPI0032DAE5A3